MIAYLFMRVPQFVLENGLPVGQVLNLASEEVEGFNQLLDQPIGRIHGQFQRPRRRYIWTNTGGLSKACLGEAVREHQSEVVGLLRGGKREKKFGRAPRIQRQSFVFARPEVGPLTPAVQGLRPQAACVFNVWADAGKTTWAVDRA